MVLWSVMFRSANQRGFQKEQLTIVKKVLKKATVHLIQSYTEYMVV